MNTEGWFYGAPGGEVQGPLPIDTIRAAVSAGRLPDTVAVSRHAAGPWAPLPVVSKLGDDAFGAGGKKRAAILAAKEAAGPAGRSVGGFIEAFGYVSLAAGILCLLGMFFSWNHRPAAIPAFMSAAASGILSGLMFLAIAEVLRRLGEISRALRQQKGD